MGKVEFNFHQVQSGVFTVNYCLNGEQMSAEEPAHSQEEAEIQLWGRLSVVYTGQDCYLGTLKTGSKVESKDDLVKKMKKNFK